MLPKNMGEMDRLIRALIAIVIVSVSFLGKITGMAGIVLLLVAAYLLLTNLVRFCPLYAVFKISTKEPPRPRRDLGQNQ